jgi:hypothetical protein
MNGGEQKTAHYFSSVRASLIAAGRRSSNRTVSTSGTPSSPHASASAKDVASFFQRLRSRRASLLCSS